MHFLFFYLSLSHHTHWHTNAHTLTPASVPSLVGLFLLNISGKGSARITSGNSETRMKMGENSAKGKNNKWNFNFPPHRRTNRPTNRRTWGFIAKKHKPRIQKCTSLSTDNLANKLSSCASNHVRSSIVTSVCEHYFWKRLKVCLSYHT